MEQWLRICCLLCVYGFLREMRPSDPFFVEYIEVENFRNISQSEINRSVLPVATYSYMLALIVTLVVTDFLRYKPVIFMASICGIIAWSMIIWTKTLLELQVAHLFYGIFLAGEIAYYTYIYAKVDKIYFAKVTAYARAAMLAGKCIACIVAQISISKNYLSYKTLHIITLVGQVCAALWSLRLPRSRKSLFFHRHYSVVDTINFPIPPAHVRDDEEAAERISNLSQSEFEQISTARLLWVHISEAYTTKQILVWSIFYGCSSCGFLQVQSYIQVLWKEINPSTELPLNAGVEGIFRLFGAVAAVTAGYIESIDLSPRAYAVLAALLTAIQGVTVIFSCLTDQIMFSYAGYIGFGALFNFLITIASTEIAKELESESYALIFGINTFFALVMQSIVTLVVVSEAGYALSVVKQYEVSGIFLIAVGCGYTLFEIVDYFISKREAEQYRIQPPPLRKAQPPIRKR